MSKWNKDTFIESSKSICEIRISIVIVELIKFSETTADIDVEDSDGNIDTFTMNIPIIYAAATNVSWNATLTGFPTTLTQNAQMTSFNLSDSITDAPADKTFNVVGTKPSWLTLNHSTGQLTGTPTATAAVTSVTFRIRETGNASNSDTITVTFPAVEAAASGPTWSAPTITATYTYPSTLTVDTAMTAINLSALSVSGLGIISYSDDAMFPSGISLSGSTISGTPGTDYAFSTTTRITATDSYDSSTSYIDITFPMVNAPTGTVAFQTPSTLTSKIQSEI